MNKRLALLAILAAGIASLAAVPGSTAAPAHAGKACSTTESGYVTANLSWGVECLHNGEFCKVGNVEYHSYGFDCPGGRLTSYSGTSGAGSGNSGGPSTGGSASGGTGSGAPLVPINGLLTGFPTGSNFEAWTLCFPSYGSTLASGTLTWGDGMSMIVGSAASGISHAYAYGGTYVVTLTCQDSASYTWTQSVSASVSGPSASPSSSSTPSPSSGSASKAGCSAGYVSANLPWGHKCLRAGEFCKVGNAAYRRYGFMCPASGHLRRR
jgi:hypothetical protein